MVPCLHCAHCFASVQELRLLKNTIYRQAKLFCISFAFGFCCCYMFQVQHLQTCDVTLMNEF